MHDICCKLWYAGITYDSHHEEGRTRLCLVAKIVECQRELRGVYDAHEERNGQHGIDAYIASKTDDDYAEYHICQSIECQHLRRFDPCHNHRTNPTANKEGQHVEAKECRSSIFVDACIGAAIDKEKTVDSSLSAIIEELCYNAPAKMRTLEC